MTVDMTRAAAELSRDNEQRVAASRTLTPPGVFGPDQINLVKQFLAEVATIDRSIAGSVLIKDNPEMLLRAVIEAAKAVRSKIG